AVVEHDDSYVVAVAPEMFVVGVDRLRNIAETVGGDDERQFRILHRATSTTWWFIDSSYDAQSLTSNAKFRRVSVLRRSGKNPSMTDPGGPWLPPTGVMPPGPEKYGTFAARWSSSKRKVVYWSGM